MTDSNHRHSEYPIDSIFLDRWSPRAFTGEAIDVTTLLTMLDAAHWAPSASNLQPWRFVYARRDTADWPSLLAILDESNQIWAKNASALLIVISRTHRITASGERRPSYTHAFDAGAAWYALAMQAHMLGFHAHGMAGIDRDKAIRDLGIPADYRVEAAVAIGRLADKQTLPADLKAREVPSGRKALSEVAFEGRFLGE
ncbi:nitroreductase family protein [Rhizobiaceae bacterium n13]|uniref:Nitroreductase family protein n=1 Tax=Ferirhizobium litorale TaxID=2927786 RepID=A0AAE3QCJ4_9HYPH|nr:nitroreductase family protein [Fererhizobium litorale]MDI7863036.1 nitroreductase family protein [Fererhizobium litorale]MDI7923287.1 nitroreductase family protein [Fererhizobium litorale]